MHAYIFEHLEWVSSSYHTDGSAIIIAPTLDRAREIYTNYLKEQPKNDYAGPWKSSHEAAKTITPDHTYTLTGNPPEEIHVFPDSGCC